MSKMPIGWHEQCLKNMEATLYRYEEELGEFQKKIKRLNMEVAFRKGQLEEAKARKLDGFDQDKFYQVGNPLKEKKK